MTLKAGYRNIRGGVLKAVRGKRQINTFHIPLRWSAIDHGPRLSAAPPRNPARSAAAKRAILIRRDGRERLAHLLLCPSTADLCPPLPFSRPVSLNTLRCEIPRFILGSFFRLLRCNPGTAGRPRGDDNSGVPSHSFHLM